MPGPLLTVASTILCPHGGTVTLTTSNSVVRADAAFVLLESDVHPVVGCPFTIGTKPSPCVRVEWQAGAAKSTIRAAKPLVQSSVGLCYSPESAPQGVAIIASTQQKGIAQ